jgi:hypothetical protein
MTNISLHTIDRPHFRSVAATCDSSLSKLLTNAPTTGRDLGRLQDTAITRAACENATDSDWDLARGALLVAARTTVANFDSAAHPGERITHLLTGDIRTDFDGRGDDACAHVQEWINGFFCAAICREETLLDALCNFDVSLMRRARGVEAEEYVYAWAEVLRAIWTNDERLLSTITLAVDKTDRGTLKFTDERTVLMLSVPLMEMVTRLYSEGRARFDEAMTKALASHREYWGDPSRAHDARGLLALGPLALACIAHDMGHAAGVRSPYVPSALIAGHD